MRAPGQPGGGPALGPSAATAVAAAASARPRPTAPLPDSGLFAAAARPADDTGTGSATGADGTDGTETAVPTGKAAPSATAAPSAKAAPSVPAAPSAPAASLQTPPAPVQPAADKPTAAPTAPAAPAPLPTRPVAPAAKQAPPTATPAQAGTPSPFEVEARAAAAASSARFVPPGAAGPLIGSTGAGRAQTPIFDSISVWFSDDRTAHVSRAGEPAQVIDLRDGAAKAVPPPAAKPAAPAGPTGPAEPSAAGPGTGTPSRWASLGDQRWIATNLRAAAAPETAGSTSTGLPRRRPGANLLPSAAAAAGAPTAAQGGLARRTDAESVRGRLGSYQRGLSSARRARHLPPESSGGLFHGGTEAGNGHQGGDS